MAEVLDKTLIEMRKSKEDLNILYWLKLKQIFDYLNTLFFHVNYLWERYVAKELRFFLIKTTFV